MADLRKDKSAPASLKVKYKSATVEQFVAQFGADISPTGIFVKTKKPVETGALLKFNFLLADKTSVLSGVGKVVWRREPGAEYPAGMGIRFIKLAGESQAVVNRIVQERGRPESRFDQHQGAELAAASLAPGRTSGTPAAPVPVSDAHLTL
ncbi:MAG: TIGR02266 family protein, partial [Myxococcales bacterium]|nr:TIGR02266 family protein [Myxococcales bacterium]